MSKKERGCDWSKKHTGRLRRIKNARGGYEGSKKHTQTAETRAVEKNAHGGDAKSQKTHKMMRVVKKHTERLRGVKNASDDARGQIIRVGCIAKRPKGPRT